MVHDSVPGLGQVVSLQGSIVRRGVLEQETGLDFPKIALRDRASQLFIWSPLGLREPMCTVERFDPPESFVGTAANPIGLARAHCRASATDRWAVAGFQRHLSYCCCAGANLAGST